MTKRPDWRSPDYVEALKDLDRAGFAWEFLRRNPAYREDYDGIAEDPDEAELSPDGGGRRLGAFLSPAIPHSMPLPRRFSGGRSSCPMP